MDSVCIDSRVWPRACAVAERLWSSEGITSTSSAMTRLIEHRCRLAQRKIGAGPVAPDWCPLPIA